jgi:hypothetical protein
VIVHRELRLTFIVTALLAMVTPALAQTRGAPLPTARTAAPVDLTGYWVAVVSEDWRYRMITPAKGDYRGVPITKEALQIVNTWNPAADEAAGNQCKSYGAAAVMRLPGRIHITWQDDNTLKIDTDSGTQTRLLHFGGASPAGQAPSWQGYSAATWRRPARTGTDKNAGDLRVVTNRLRPGYLRKNGVPYSENATMEEFFDAFTEPNGDSWLVIDTIVTDPTYLTQPYINSAAFKKLRDASGWDPTPCRADQPR